MRKEYKIPNNTFTYNWMDTENKQNYLANVE